MTVHLAGATANVIRTPRTPLAPIAPGIGVLACLLILMGSAATRFRKPARRLAAFAILLAAVSGSVLLLSACSGGFGGLVNTPQGNYVITVTGTSGSLSASTTVTLVVK